MTYFQLTEELFSILIFFAILLVLIVLLCAELSVSNKQKAKIKKLEEENQHLLELLFNEEEKSKI